MANWTLIRHRKAPVFYWANMVPGEEVEIRYPLPVVAPGPDMPAIRPVDHSPSAGTFPTKAVHELYAPIGIERATEMVVEVK